MNLNSALLLLTLLMPLITVSILLTVKDTPENTANSSKVIACVATLINLVISVFLLAVYDPYNLVEVRSTVLSSIKFDFFLELNSLSLLFLLVINLLFLVVFWFFGERFLNRITCVLLLLLHSTLIGAFSAENLWLFYIFVELAIFLIFCLAYHLNKRPQIIYFKFIVFYSLSASLILMAFIYMYAVGNQTDINLLHTVQYKSNQSHLLWWMLFVGFAINMGLVPFQLWIEEINETMQGIVTLIISCIVMKLGFYGCLKILALGFPVVTAFYSHMVIWLIFLTILYASYKILVVDNTLVFIGYFSLFQLALQLVGIFNLNVVSYFGAVYQTFNNSLLVIPFTLVFIFLEDRIGTYSFKSIEECSYHMPIFKLIVFLLTIVGSSMPGTSFFSGNLCIIVGMFALYPICGLLCSVMLFIVTCIMLAKLYKSILYNNHVNMPSYKKVSLTQSELTVTASIVLLLLVFFIYMGPIIHLLRQDMSGFTKYIEYRPQLFLNVSKHL